MAALSLSARALEALPEEAQCGVLPKVHKISHQALRSAPHSPVGLVRRSCNPDSGQLAKAARIALQAPFPMR